jgi:formate-dependent nitrite reductase membrane component NrfD
VWIWSVPLYFWVGGVAGAAMTMSTAAQLFGGRSLRAFDERCRRVGAIGGGLGTALLIHDLGYKRRFLFMLRVFRPSSPMSVGSWVLALATPLTAGAAVLTKFRGWPRDLGRMAGIGGGVLGMPLATYTGVLIGNTAVPVWAAARRSLPVLFGASAVASLGAVFELMPLGARERTIARRFGRIGQVAELAAMAAVEYEAARVPQVVKPLRYGATGALWKAGAILTASAVAVSVLGGRRRKMRAAAGVLGIAGSLCMRFGVFYAGKLSARDPHATFDQQRAGTPSAHHGVG